MRERTRSWIEGICGLIAGAGTIYLIFSLFGCAAVDGFFTDPDGQGPQSAPAVTTGTVASALGGPWGELLAAGLAFASLAWQSWHAANTKARHAKFSSAKKPA